MTNPDYRALITEMAAELDHCQQLLLDDRRQRHPLADRARAALAEPEAEGPTDEELLESAAKALGYKHDSSQVDGKKYPAHQAAQKCNNCQFWQGSATDAWAGCSMFGRKHIAAAGWCLAYKKV